MTRKLFEQHLHDLQDHVLMMGSMVETSIYRSMDSLKNRNLELAQKVIDDDDQIDLKRYEIEEECIDLIITQQPMAGDLRIIIAVLNIIIDLERIADHAAGISKIAVMLGNEPPLKPLVDLPRMAEMTGGMLRRALTAFINHDTSESVKICSEDDNIDNLYDQVFRELLVYMAEDPKSITRATRLIWVAHNLERSADRVTNIAERVIYLVTGKHEDLLGSKY